MTELADVRNALKTVLEPLLSGLTVYPLPKGQVNIPALLVRPGDVDFDVSMARGTDTWDLDLTILVSRADDELGQSKLDPYVTGGGSSSIRKHIFENKTLGLSDCNVHIAGMTGYAGNYLVGADTYLGAKLRLVAHIKPTS